MRWTGGARVLGQWLVLGALVGVVCGVASAGFLWLLDAATQLRERQGALVY
ncbi:chloride channel protein, partial [Myxococcus sp. CA039A]|nr:chloride channel protein [Myxococcus sp. CA039A]